MHRSSQTQCSYTYDPPTDDTDEGRVDIERPDYGQCPHDVVDPDERRCIFHHGEKEYPSERFTEQFLDLLADTAYPPTFAGGRLAGIELQDTTLTTESKQAIDLRGTVIDGDIDLTNATVEVPLLLDGAAITGSIHAEDAEFECPVSLAGADIRGGVHSQGATIRGGLAANDMNAGYVDARTLTVDGPLDLDRSTFASNLLLANATVDGDLGLERAAFDWSLDVTAAIVDGEFDAAGISIDEDFDAIAAHVGDAVDLTGGQVDGETDWSHAEIGGDLSARDCQFDGEAIFNGVAVDGDTLAFDGTEFAAKADFATVSLPACRVSFEDTTFSGDVWFTHGTIGRRANFDGATFEEMSHLRDAAFEADLVLRNVDATGQFFLHGSTVDGDFNCTDARFDHFQFSATVHGISDFTRARFEEKAIFRSSTFGDSVWFDDASFAGFIDFTDTRFTGETSFEGTEFLVDPTFEETRFAVDPDLTAASFPLADAIDFSDRRDQMILAHPDSLRHQGETLSVAEVREDFSVPAKAAHLVEDDFSKTRAIARALSEFGSRSWYEIAEEALRTARTAVAELPDRDSGVLVFGLTIDPDGNGTDLIADVMVAGVYCRQNDRFVFGHLDPAFFDVDYLLPIPATDDAFESGAAVATSSELQHAAVRNEMFRAALLGRQDSEDSPINRMVIPVLLGATAVE